MSQAMDRYVQVLDLRAQQALADFGQAQARLARTQTQLERLKTMGLTSGLKNSAGNVALYANAAGFRSGLMDMAEQCRDACSVQQLECDQARQQLQQAERRLGSMDSVLQAARAQADQVQARQAQKVMDEMAGQAWLRQRQAAAFGNR